jgi:hypothetical protein
MSLRAAGRRFWYRLVALVIRLTELLGCLV